MTSVTGGLVARYDVRDYSRCVDEWSRRLMLKKYARPKWLLGS